MRSVKATELSTVVGARKGHGTQMLASINLDMNPFTGHSLYPELFNSEPAPTHWILCMCGCLCTVCVCVLRGPQKALHSLAQIYAKAVTFILLDQEEHSTLQSWSRLPFLIRASSQMFEQPQINTHCLQIKCAEDEQSPFSSCKRSETLYSPSLE